MPRQMRHIFVLSLSLNVALVLGMFVLEINIDKILASGQKQIAISSLTSISRRRGLINESGTLVHPSLGIRVHWLP